MTGSGVPGGTITRIQPLPTMPANRASAKVGKPLCCIVARHLAALRPPVQHRFILAENSCHSCFVAPGTRKEANRARANPKRTSA
jgi:hypothetical protein